MRAPRRGRRSRRGCHLHASAAEWVHPRQVGDRGVRPWTAGALAHRRGLPQQGRIPHADVVRHAQRGAAIERMGGVDVVAARIGRSRSAASRYRSGETNELGAEASKKLENVTAQDIMKRAGVLRPDGTPKTAVVRDLGGVMFRNTPTRDMTTGSAPWISRNSDTPSPATSPANLPPRWLTTITPECAATNNTTASLGSPSCRWEVGISVWWCREVPVPGRRP